VPLIMKIVCFGMWPFEIGLVICEICRKSDPDNAHLAVTFSEKEKRIQFGLSYLRIAYVSFTVMVIAFLAMFFTLKQKRCGYRQSLSWWVVCTDCELEHCDDCFFSGPQSCNRCDLGYYYSPVLNKCMDCDSYEKTDTCAVCETQNKCK